ncbi:MAG: hypothetical protein LBS86_02520, partial [Treponema sp.]|nr:hypothetical protein [Treponema sp.]
QEPLLSGFRKRGRKGGWESGVLGAGLREDAAAAGGRATLWGRGEHGAMDDGARDWYTVG